jgi:hypothetical protein
MRRTLLKVLLLASAFVIIGFIVILVNQTAQLVMLANNVAPWLGRTVFWTLITLYTFCVAVPLYLILRLPKPLRPPASAEDPAFPAHLERSRGRLGTNPHLKGQSLATQPELEASLRTLDALAETRTRDAASQVFVTTAISQNGSLDGFLVLAAQSKLVLEIARTYYQRPTIRDLAFLYSNVAATAFIATELEDLDLAEQVQPIIGAAFGSAAGAIPGFGAATTLFINSVTTGAANAFLTLRVGVITQEYCRATVLPSRRTVRRIAVLKATQLLGAITLAGTKRVAGAIGSGSKSAIGDAFVSLGDQIKQAGAGIKGASTTAMSKLRFWQPREPGDSEVP